MQLFFVGALAFNGKKALIPQSRLRRASSLFRKRKQEPDSAHGAGTDEGEEKSFAVDKERYLCYNQEQKIIY